MPTVQPFRALRYAPEVVPDLAAVIAPPYDVIDPDARRRLAARDPRNIVRLDLPIPEPGDEPDERYRRAARLLSAWRSDGTLHRDPRPSLYPYEQTYRVPGSDVEHTRRGVFARVGLEAFGPDAGIRPHERTLAEPKEDRYRLLRATGVNTSPVVGMYDDASGVVPAWLEGLADPPVGDVVDEDGVRHRLWRVPADDDSLGPVLAALGSSPITIADGHHRYETALRYRDERMTGAPAAEEAPGWASILMLLLEPVAGPLTVLATHRVLLGIAGSDHAGMDALPELFEIEPIHRDRLAGAFEPGAAGAGGRGRFGLWTRDGGFLLTARRPAFEALLPEGGPALRRLDVSLAGSAIERLTGIDAVATESGRIRYTKDPVEAIRWVDEQADGADAALLLEPTPAADIVAVAAEGDVMPQKSTYIYPKALTGLVINPLE
ncbi:MAG TPA: DUF1015 domain-containing protein [Candidatus Limnocylindrales bacterium]|nr:DUF1015 domain-containing protein [Candidatus Limnocylindrales bacterium]